MVWDALAALGLLLLLIGLAWAFHPAAALSVLGAAALSIGLLGAWRSKR